MSNRWSDPTPWWSGSSRATAALSPVIGPLSAARLQQPWRARQIDGSGALALSLATAAVGAPNARYGAGWPVRAASPESVYGVLEGRLDRPHRAAATRLERHRRHGARPSRRQLATPTSNPIGSPRRAARRATSSPAPTILRCSIIDSVYMPVSGTKPRWKYSKATKPKRPRSHPIRNQQGTPDGGRLSAICQQSAAISSRLVQQRSGRCRRMPDRHLAPASDGAASPPVSTED